MFELHEDFSSRPHDQWSAFVHITYERLYLYMTGHEQNYPWNVHNPISITTSSANHRPMISVLGSKLTSYFDDFKIPKWWGHNTCWCPERRTCYSASGTSGTDLWRGPPRLDPSLCGTAVCVSIPHCPATTPPPDLQRSQLLSICNHILWSGVSLPINFNEFIFGFWYLIFWLFNLQQKTSNFWFLRSCPAKHLHFVKSYYHE